MACPHGLRSTPATCSQCANAAPRIVTNSGPEVVIDGKPTGRALDRESGRFLHYQRRGGLRRGKVGRL